MSKRFISVFMLVCIFLCSLTFTAVAKTEYDYSQAVEMVKAFGIYKPENNSGMMTRGEFAEIVSSIINYGTKLGQSDGKFKDVTSEDSFSGAVYDLASRKIVSGYTEDMFKPETPILYEQAVKIILSAAGYDDYVEAKRGSYPGTYLLIASDRGLTKNIDKSTGETLTPYETAQLIANALECCVFKQTVFGGKDGFEIVDNVTLMSEYLDVKKVEGIVKDNGITTLTGDSKIGNEYVIIANELYKKGTTKVQNMLGYKVNAYIRESDDTIIYVLPDKHMELITVKADRLLTEDSSFSVTNIVYTDVYNKERNLSVKLGADFIYNGKAYNDLRVDELKLSAGELVLVDNNNDGIYDVVYVNSARIVVASGVNAELEIIYGKNGASPLNIGEAEFVRLIKDGREVSFNTIREWDVLSIYESKDEQVVTIKISSSKLTGTVEEFSNTEQIIGINGEYYHVTDKTVFDSIKLGAGYEFCLDVDTNVVAVKNIDVDSKNVALFVKAATIASGVSSEAQIKLYTTTGSHIVYPLAKKLVVDGDGNKTTSEAVDYLMTNADKKLICFKLNAGGEVREINLPYEGAVLPASKKGLLHKYHAEPMAETGKIGLTYSSAQRTLKGLYALSNNIKVIQVPLSDEPEDDEFSVNGIGYFGNQNNYDNFDLYSFGEEDARADFMVIFKDPTPQYTGGTYPVVVSKIKHVATNDGDIRECLIGYDYRGEVEYIAKDDTLFTNAGIKTGDVVRCPFNILGEVQDVRLVYDGENKLIVNDVSGGFGFSDYRGFAGDLYSKYGSLLCLVPAKVPAEGSADKGGLGTHLSDNILTDEEENTINSNLRLYDIETSKIYIFDKSQGKGRVIEGTTASLYDYLGAGYNYSTVYIHDVQAVPKMVVVYQ